MFIRAAIITLLAASSLLLAGCQGDQEWVRSYRLERSFALANAYWDANTIEIASEASRALLIDGWSFAETNKEGETFRWSNGSSSTFGFMVFEPEDSTLQLRGLGFPFESTDSTGPQTVSVTVNAQPLGVAVLEPGFREFSLAVPTTALIPGRNDFELQYSWTRSALESQAGKRWNRAQRNLAAAWTSISLSGSGTPPVAAATQPPNNSADLFARTLSLAAGSWVEFELELAPGSRISVDGMTCNGCNPDRALVEVFVGGVKRTRIAPVGTLTNATRTIALVPPQPTLPLAEQLTGSTRTLILHVPPVGSPQEVGATVALDAPTIERPQLGL